ncbi:uncharacterized protein [Penaeus vannamei]|uniref:uncharacterized protein n=1 Tax=Penaeus vannamei TaxID=6689 RepID=UPI00387F86FD
MKINNSVSTIVALLNKIHISRLKVDHVPIRVECHSISKRGKQECLGYIIMPLATAVLGVESDPNWHKLLGGPSVPHKKPPSIRLALCLRNTKNEEAGGLSSQDAGKSVRRQVRDRPSGRSLDAYRENLPRRSHRRFSEEGHSTQNKDDLEEEYEDEDLVSHPGLDFRNGSKEDQGFLSNRKGVSPRLPASKSPGWTQAVSHSPRRDTYLHSAEISPRRAVQHRANKHNHEIRNERDYQAERNEWEGIKIKQEQENGTEMEVDEDYGDFKVFEDSMREAYYRNSHGGTSQGSRPLSNTDQKHSSLDEIVNKCVNGRQMLKNAMDGAVEQEKSSKHNRTRENEEASSRLDAKNIQLMPNKMQTTSIPACFSYSLLGYPIKTDPIKDLKQPNFLAERAAGKIRATPANLSAYFSQNPQLQIHLPQVAILVPGSSTPLVLDEKRRIKFLG